MAAERAVRSGVAIEQEGHVGGNQVVCMSGDKRCEAVLLHEVLKHREILNGEDAWQIHDCSILPEPRGRTRSGTWRRSTIRSQPESREPPAIRRLLKIPGTPARIDCTAVDGMLFTVITAGKVPVVCPDPETSKGAWALT
jgi:hypothetical protein